MSGTHEETLLGELEQLASKYGMDVYDLARLAQEQYSDASRAKALAHSDASHDRRFFPRSAVRRTAVAQICEENLPTRYVSCTITDLSFNGVQILFPTWMGDTFMAAALNDFELLFSLPEKNLSICLRCRTIRMHSTPEFFIVGAECEQSQLEHLQAMQRNGHVKHWCVHPNSVSPGTN